MAISIEDLGRMGNEAHLNRAIKEGDRPVIVECLRKLTGPLPVQIAHKLADYLDPERPPIGTMQKSSTVEKREWKKWQVLRVYELLQRDKENARWFLNAHDEAFLVEENTEWFDEEGRFSPQWKFPYLSRERDRKPFPKKGDIQLFLCQQYGISQRTLDTWLSENRAKRLEK